MEHAKPRLSCENTELTQVSEYEQDEEPQGSHFNEAGSQVFPSPRSNHSTMGLRELLSPTRTYPTKDREIPIHAPSSFLAGFPDCTHAFVKVAGSS